MVAKSFSGKLGERSYQNVGTTYIVRINRNFRKTVLTIRKICVLAKLDLLVFNL